MDWSEMAGQITDLGSGKVFFYRDLRNFPDHCAVLEIAREEVRNAIDGETAQCLMQGLDILDHLPEIRVLILTGRGNKAFVSGGDLREYAAKFRTKQDVLDAFAVMRAVLRRLYFSTRFTIAAVGGPARGGGAELAFACHYRIMAEKASIGFIQATQGIPPAWGGGALLAEQVGRAKARLALASGVIFHASEALADGLIDEVAHTNEQMVRRLQRLVQRFGRSTRTGMEAVANLFTSGGQELERQMEAETELCATLWFTSEHMKILEKYS